MLRTIISISGKPGLFKILSNTKNALIVEDITTGKRFPATARDKIVSLGDISMYTESEDRPLDSILDAVYAKHEGKTIDINAVIAGEGLRAAFDEIVPDHDHDRVYESDIKKLFKWYNLLVAAGYTKFTEEEPAAEEESTKE